MNRHDIEILTVEQFADRLQVSRTTVFSWLKHGVLLEGVHYLRIGRTLRFGWHANLFFNSQPHSNLDNNAASPAPLLTTGTQGFKRGKAPVNSKPFRGETPAINLDY